MRVSRISISMMALLALAITQAPARAAESSARTIVVSGSGEARARPDLANLSFAIETHAPTAAEASSRNAALAQKVIDALKAKLDAKGIVSTGGYSLTPDYEQGEHRTRPRIVGYNAQNSITVQTGALTLVGGLIDSAVAAGANRVNYLNFTLKDDTHARGEAIAAASHDAQAQARALAASLGLKLGRVIKATTVSEARPMPMAQYQGLAMSARAATPIEPGEMTVPATVTLTYEIE
jgi:uncharacterized protein YggE